MTREEKTKLVMLACPHWFLLKSEDREALIDGRCVYSSHQGVAYLDYTKKHPIFSQPAKASA